MFYDADPGKIVARLTRRDDEIESDNASIRIDAYHDHQTGYEFTFNAAGVKTDILQYEDANKEDASWDPVWDVHTVITSEGWSAEVRIPLQVLRFRSLDSDTAENEWGVNFLRYISRKNESERWAFTPKSESGFISRYGHLKGLRGLPDVKRLEVLPFATARQRYDPATDVEPRRQKLSGDFGVDLKYGLSSNFTIDATFNPDFGQVEADPAVLNLSTFETFYPEKRPFFIEGTQIIRFTTFGGTFGPGMFYSRRIGRGISDDEVAVPPGGRIEDVPQQVTILGAAKLSGRTNGGLSIGMLEAFTEEERGRVTDSLGASSEQVLEPFAHYNILRVKQDVMGNSTVGAIVTSVAKNGRYPAFANGYDWDLKFDNTTYQLNGFLALSHTTSPDDARVFGGAGKINFGRIAGEHWLWSASTDFTSKRYNINDVGFFFRPNDFGGVLAVTYKEDVPSRLVRSWAVNLNGHMRQNFDGVNLNRQLSASGGLTWANYWGIEASAGIDFGMYDDRETRGLGLYRKASSYFANMTVATDGRNDVAVELSGGFDWDDKRRERVTGSAEVSARPLTWMQLDAEGEYERVRNQEAWIDNVNGAAIFADRSTDRYTFTLRWTTTLTRELTVQVYAQQFMASGRYANFRSLLGTAEFQPASYAGDPDFNREAFNTNVVLRWEFSPGSTFYLVWSQAREGSGADGESSFNNQLTQTFNLPPANVVLAKISYWWSL
jgi:hypothetical protein